jgi:hypothetical protein
MDTSGRRATRARQAGTGEEAELDINSKIAAPGGQPPAGGRPAGRAAGRARPAAGGPGRAGGYRVAVLSAALLRAVIREAGGGYGGFADRAGVAGAVVSAAADGTRPAWALPYAEFTAIAAEVAEQRPGAAFETAAACDLLLTSVLNGDLVMATDVLTEPSCRDLARDLLALAVAGTPGSGPGLPVPALLPPGLVAVLGERAAALAGSGSPDAWAGREILNRMPRQAMTAGQPGRAAARIDANGTAWRMRSLVAMGHDATRIARALNVPPGMVRRLIRGDCQTVTADFRRHACLLWDAWWDKTPPERTAAERQAATRARRQASHHDWPAAAGLDEDQLDNPGYRPRCRYRPATGTGVAAGFTPVSAPRRTA